MPDPVIARADRDPEAGVVLADSVGLALLVVLETLEPAERLAFVLHDVFGMSFDEIAPIVDRSSVAARQLASRARRRVQGRAPSPDRDLRQQRRIVEAFLAGQAATFSKLGLMNQFVLVNGTIGLVSRRAHGRVFSVPGFTIAGGKIVEIDILADPARLGRLDLSALEG